MRLSDLIPALSLPLTMYITKASPHQFHIPVMGLGFTLDTPVKLAHFGISSVVSIMEDQLIERMREILCREHNRPFEKIPEDTYDHRAKRISAYLDLLEDIVHHNTEKLRNTPFTGTSDIDRYFELLPE